MVRAFIHMLRVSLQRYFTTPVDKVPRSIATIWLGLSLVVAVICGLLGWQAAFSSDYVVQDDARQHVFWMQRFIEPTLFPNDEIANYFQSIAPYGYALLYKGAAALGISPLLWNKLLPMGLGLIATGYCFGVSLQLLPVPFAGFVSALLLNQNLWIRDDLVSGTARSFVFPIVLAFLYYLLRRSVWPCLLTIALQGLFYPQYVFIMAIVLILRGLTWQGGIRWAGNRRDRQICILGLAIVVLVMLPYAFKLSDSGPVITAAQARMMPEFARGGRVYFFDENPWLFWVTGKSSGLLSGWLAEEPWKGWADGQYKRLFGLMPWTIVAPLLLPLMLRWPAVFPLGQHSRNLSLFGQLGAAALVMFAAAHATLFRLYLPSRYMQYTLQILTALAAGMAIVIGIDSVLRWAERRSTSWRWMGALSVLLFVLVTLLISPRLYPFPKPVYIQGTVPSLYQFLAQQPRDSLIASFAKEADNLPTFAQRSVLVSPEYALPYHPTYYRHIRQRAVDLLQAQYSPRLSDVLAFVRTYGIDFWLIDERYLTTTQVDDKEQKPVNQWLQQFKPEIMAIEQQLQNGQQPILASLGSSCTVFRKAPLKVIDIKCLLRLRQNFNEVSRVSGEF